MAVKMPHEGHNKHMCYMVNMKASVADLKKVAKDAAFICKSCGRSAKDKKHLCNPVKL